MLPNLCLLATAGFTLLIRLLGHISCRPYHGTHLWRGGAAKDVTSRCTRLPVGPLNQLSAGQLGGCCLALLGGAEELTRCTRGCWARCWASRAAVLAWRSMRRAMVVRPLKASQQSKGPRIAPSAFCNPAKPEATPPKAAALVPRQRLTETRTHTGGGAGACACPVHARRLRCSHPQKGGVHGWAPCSVHMVGARRRAGCASPTTPANLLCKAAAVPWDADCQPHPCVIVGGLRCGTTAAAKHATLGLRPAQRRCASRGPPL